MRVIWLILLLFAAPVAARAQAWLDQPGVAGGQVIAIGSANVRLPPGQWLPAADTTGSAGGAAIGLPEQIYLQTDGKRIVAVAYLRSNGKPAPNRFGFQTDKLCTRNDVFFNDSRNVYPGQFDCLIVNHWMMSWDAPPPVWQAAKERAAAYGGLPRPLVAASYYMASPDRSGFVAVNIYCNPAVAGFVSNPNVQWGQSEWHRNNAMPDRVAYLNKVATWARAYRTVIAASWN
jgi:hypothetical protein